MNVAVRLCLDRYILIGRGGSSGVGWVEAFISTGCGGSHDIFGEASPGWALPRRTYTLTCRSAQFDGQ